MICIGYGSKVLDQKYGIFSIFSKMSQYFPTLECIEVLRGIESPVICSSKWNSARVSWFHKYQI